MTSQSGLVPDDSLASGLWTAGSLKCGLIGDALAPRRIMHAALEAAAERPRVI